MEKIFYSSFRRRRRRLFITCTSDGDATTAVACRVEKKSRERRSVLLSQLDAVEYGRLGELLCSFGISRVDS